MQSNLRHLATFESFATEIGVKNKWVRLDNEMKDKLKSELFDLINSSYAAVGGHLEIAKDDDIMRQKWNVWLAQDLDDDPETDAVVFGRKFKYGTKFSGIGQDGTKDAKRAVLDLQASSLKKHGFYAEASEKIAEIFVKKYNVPIVTDPKKIEEIVGKDFIKFVGEHPDGFLPEIKSWYLCTIAGHKEYKLLFGITPR